jgi:hypothetical protein
MTAIVADTCSDRDCNGCCTKNARPTGFLLDMEYWTVLNNFGSLDTADGSISFSFDGNVSNIPPGDDGDDDGGDDYYDDDTSGSSFGTWDVLYYALFFGLPACMVSCVVWYCCCRHRAQQKEASRQYIKHVAVPVDVGLGSGKVLTGSRRGGDEEHLESSSPVHAHSPMVYLATSQASESNERSGAAGGRNRGESKTDTEGEVGGGVGSYESVEITMDGIYNHSSRTRWNDDDDCY